MIRSRIIGRALHNNNHLLLHTKRSLHHRRGLVATNLWNNHSNDKSSNGSTSIKRTIYTPAFRSVSLSPPNHLQQSSCTHQHQQVRTKVFVSRHNNSLNVTANQVLEYCNHHGGLAQQAKTTPSHVILKECPCCSKPTNDKPSNLYKLYIQIGSGAFFCHRCGTGGSWYDFKAHIGGFETPSTSHSGSSTMMTVGGPGGGQSYGDNTSHSNMPPRASSSSSTASAPLPMPPARLASYYSTRLLDPQYDKEDNVVLTYLQETRGLDRKTLRKYGVGRAHYKFPGDRGYEEAECVTFPWIMRESDVQMQEDLMNGRLAPSNDTDFGSPITKKKKKASEKKPKSKKIKGDDQDSDLATAMDESPSSSPFVTRRIKARAVQQKAWQRLDPPGGGWGLFGLHTVPEDATEVVLTEGEYDAMAVHQATGRPAISLPNGCRSLPVQVLPLLERFDKIYLWMDSDAPGQEGAQKFAKKLGLNRCYLVSTNSMMDQAVDAPAVKDANDALLQGLDLNAMLEKATLVPHERILTFSDLRHEVLKELLHPELYTGVPIPSLPTFTKLIKGFRRGELTVLTGPTGSGKTTFLGQVSLDLAEQGINCLWGSFEIKNTRLLHKLLRQFSRDVLPSPQGGSATALALDALADRFESLPLHFLGFHGGSDVDEVLDAMEYAVYVNDVEHIILDNMQFMISRGNPSSGGYRSNSTFDKFDTQDMAIEKFRKFATEHNIHLTLVVHPRKEDETNKLSISSVYGSAKATQEADTVIILQNDGRRKYIEVKKNRFDGTLGYCPLYFHSASGRYTETEGGSSSSGGGESPASQTFSPPPQNKWKGRPKKESEPEIEGLENHWTECLAPKAT